MDSDSQGHAASADTSGISSPGFGVSPGRRSVSPSAAIPTMASVPQVSHHVVALQNYTAAQEGTEILAFSGLADSEELAWAANAGSSGPSGTLSSNLLCAGASDPEGLGANAAQDQVPEDDVHLRNLPVLAPNGAFNGIGFQVPCPSRVCEFHLEGTGHGENMSQADLHPQGANPVHNSAHLRHELLKTTPNEGNGRVLVGEDAEKNRMHIGGGTADIASKTGTKQHAVFNNILTPI